MATEKTNLKNLLAKSELGRDYERDTKTKRPPGWQAMALFAGVRGMGKDWSAHYTTFRVTGLESHLTMIVIGRRVVARYLPEFNRIQGVATCPMSFSSKLHEMVPWKVDILVLPSCVISRAALWRAGEISKAWYFRALR